VTTTTDVEVSRRRHWRGKIPEEHRASIDTRVAWLWNQRFGTVQTVWKDSPDTLDRTAATMILQAIVASDLDSIILVFKRLEGGPLVDEDLLEQQTKIRV
jgi:hypothetical protein